MTGEELMEFFSISSDILTKKAEVVAQIVMGEADVRALDDLCRGCGARTCHQAAADGL